MSFFVVVMVITFCSDYEIINYIFSYALPPQGVLILFLVQFTPLKYNNTYEYPWWGHTLGLLLAFASIISVPLWILYSVAKTPGSIPQV